MSRHLLVAASLLATSLSYYLLAAHPFNWTGGDEWGAIDVASQGIVTCEHCTRICLAYNWLAYQIWPGTLWGFRIFAALSLWAGGLALYSLGQRLFPRQRFLAVGWAVFYVVFVTRDFVKLFPVYTATYAFSVTVTLWAMALYLESWARGSRRWLVAALSLGVLAVWSYETSLPLLCLAPFVCALVKRDVDGGAFAWIGAWYGALVLAALRYAMPVLRGGSYQQTYPLLPVRRWPHAFEEQVLRHFGAIRDVTPSGLVEYSWIVAAIVAACAPLLVVSRSEVAVCSPTADRARLFAVTVLGLVCLLAGVAPYAVLFGGNPGRAHYFSTPGAVLLIIAALGWVSTFVGVRWRATAWSAFWMAFVVTFGTASALYHNSYWWDRQTKLLRQLTALVPATRPDTLIVLREPPADPSFRHPAAFYSAIRYLYGSSTAGVTDATEQVVLAVEYSADEVRVVPKNWASTQAISEAKFSLDRVIFVDESLTEGLSIATELPAQFAAANRMRYRPDASIVRIPDATSVLRLAKLSKGSPRDDSSRRLLPPS